MDTLLTRPEKIAEKHLSALYKVSSLLGNSLDYTQTVSQVLQVLHDDALLSHGMLALLDSEREMLVIDALHSPEQDANQQTGTVRYRAGEGIIGSVVSQGQPIVLARVSDDLRFADKLALYALDKPFIAVPLKQRDGTVHGVLAAQPELASTELLEHFTRLVEMIATLIGKNVLLAKNVAEQNDNLVAERDRLRRKVRGNYSFDNMVGHTRSMRKIFEQVRLVSKWDSTVLVRGESGTGKELIANAIHYNSPRANGPFVKLNCAALPDNLLESELFGHEKGAFTGAVKQRKGRFEMADGGTLFLDEVGEISAAFQAKLLRILQEGEFERVGGTQTLKVDVRIVAATNRNLEDEVRAERFREDLYYRLNVMPIYPPPLRERIEDLPELTKFLIEKLSKVQNRELSVTDGAIRTMMGYHWPGNVRELENMLERASIMSEEGSIDQDLIMLGGVDAPMKLSSSAPNLTATLAKTDLEDPEIDERERVVAALEQAGWVQAKAARLLDMTPRQIAYRIQTMNIRMRQL
ncbi:MULTISPECIES: nif-specific transcriptional activator NifA [Corallincola]|uniref:Nif-specific regulatory protein n=3 Tax=Corallincola TaxID=1775176 RepID=A0A368NPT1_9GAMM|nr:MULTISPECIES: nif-specific transcriptional activator NifA [Corallincola]RCU52552.1 nif-specific transcriptional activator NifA [Corallincola holothuriorum]TAA48256.1 nif-specific transcriptional activator NifA [Corallincola spongiicola]TCI02450.1 nif-specific transcriptional activator NifA [Corallincola luteus]